MGLEFAEHLRRTPEGSNPRATHELPPRPLACSLYDPDSDQWMCLQTDAAQELGISNAYLSLGVRFKQIKKYDRWLNAVETLQYVQQMKRPRNKEVSQ